MVRFFHLLPVVSLLLLGHAGHADAGPSGEVDVPFFLDRLKGNYTRAQKINALHHLGDSGDLQVTPVILDVIATTQDGKMREAAVGCFTDLRDPRAVEPLLKLLQQREATPKSDRADLAATIVFALGHQQDRRAVPVLLEIVRQPTEDSGIRNYAAVALGKIGDSAGNRLLVETLSDRASFAAPRLGAAEGLGYFRAAKDDAADAPDEVRVVNLLIEVVNREDEPSTLREVAVKALGKLGNPASLKSLCEVAEKNPEGKLGFWAAVTAVKISDGHLNDAAVVKTLRSYYTNPVYDEHFDKEEALEKLAANGGWRVAVELSDIQWPDVELRTIMLILAIVGSATWLLIRRKKKARAPPPATFDKLVTKADP